MDLSFMIGREIKDHDPALTGEKKVSYTVIEAYPTFVRAMRITDNGTELYKCFNIGDLVTMGALKTKAAPNKSGYRFTGKYEGRI